MKIATIISLPICLLLSACACRDVAADKMSLYLAEGYYNLGRYDESLTQARKVCRDSALFGEAKTLIAKVNHARKLYIDGGYQYIQVGSAEPESRKTPLGSATDTLPKQ